MTKKRDNFTSRTIEKLRARVGNRCSNPECRVPTTGPTTNPEKINNIGVAAHITAAAQGGPRYDKSLNINQRKSILNAIWLCSNCSRDIDNNPEKYSIEKLNKWKQLAEQKAEDELGKQLPDDNYVMNSLSSALTGQSDIFLPKIISNAHNATSKALELLDPRFRIESKFSNGVTHFNIHANETVKMKLHISPSFANEFFEKYTNFENHGDKFTLSSSALTIEGSPLLEKITDNCSGKFEIRPFQTKQAVIQVWLVAPDSSEKSYFNDLVGKAVLGKKSMTSNCESLNGLINMTIRFSITDSLPADANFTLTTNFHKWDKVPLAKLPEFTKVYSLYKKMSLGWILNFSLEIDGLPISKGHANDITKQDTFVQTLSELNFINSVKEISHILGYSLVYEKSFEYSSEFHSRINEIYKIISEGLSISSKSIQGNATCTLEATKDISNITSIVNAEKKLTSLRIDQVEPEKIAPFSQQITLPKFSHRLTEVRPIITSDLKNIKAGDLIEIEWEPTDNCKYIIEKI